MRRHVTDDRFHEDFRRFIMVIRTFFDGIPHRGRKRAADPVKGTLMEEAEKNP